MKEELKIVLVITIILTIISMFLIGSAEYHRGYRTHWKEALCYPSEVKTTYYENNIEYVVCADKKVKELK